MIIKNNYQLIFFASALICRGFAAPTQDVQYKKIRREEYFDAADRAEFCQYCRAELQQNWWGGKRVLGLSRNRFDISEKGVQSYQYVQRSG